MFNISISLNEKTIVQQLPKCDIFCLVTEETTRKVKLYDILINLILRKNNNCSLACIIKLYRNRTSFFVF